ncbi:MAG TPA: PD-(D/E)XK nuclease family protein [Sphingomicrobium sp.]|nr:PD-(D/E)XK nuclease family protein [Sphingomicrobium sp.]
MPDPQRVAVFTIPSERPFADALVAGLIDRFGREPLVLARGRILLPNNRAVRAVTDAFVRASGSGLLLPRLIPVGDPELDERAGGALDAIDTDLLPRAADPDERILRLASILPGEGAAERVRLATDLARTLDALIVEEIEPRRLKDAMDESSDLARHWEHSLARLQLIYEAWPRLLEDEGRIDLTDRRNRLLHGLARRWKEQPPAGFTVAAGITTGAPAVAALLASVASMSSGILVLPGLWLSDVLADEEWDALGANGTGRGEVTHPQYHLKLLLERMGIARAEVQVWPFTGGASSSPVRTQVIANAMAASDFSHKWKGLQKQARRLNGIRLAELPDSASEAQAIALALRHVLETPGKTAALVTPDRQLAGRVSALLARWGVVADDSAGTALAGTAAGSLLLAIANAAAEQLAPVALLALLKHPLVGGEGDQRLEWLEAVRELDMKLRGPRPAAGLVGLDKHFGSLPAWRKVCSTIEQVDRFLVQEQSLADLAGGLSTLTDSLARDAAWRGPDGRMAADFISELQASDASNDLVVSADDAVPLLRQLLGRRAVRPAYGGHPRLSIWGLLEARLQRADLVVLGGLNEGVWPAVSTPDPWLPPKVRAVLQMPTADFRIGLAAHDFASALGAPEVLVTRARRDSKAPTIASRFLLRLNAMCGSLPRDRKLEALTRTLDDAGPPRPAERPAPVPPLEERPGKITVTQVDRLNADPFSFYASAILNLRSLERVDAEHTAAWKGTAVHAVFQDWLQHDDCDPDKLRGRAERLLGGEAIHPMLRALWAPRLLEAIDWIAEMERENRSVGRRPLAAEARGETVLDGVTIEGRADRIDRLSSGGVAIVDYKTGATPSQKAVDAGFALQLGLLGLIARANGFKDAQGHPQTFEYWSLARFNGTFGRLVRPAKDVTPTEFLDDAYSNFARAAKKWLTGSEPFTAKLNPAYAPYGDYDQLMRLEEWYGR